MPDVLGNLVMPRCTRYGNRHYRARILLFEERGQRFQQERLESRRGVGDVGVHLELACEMRNLAVKTECARQCRLRTGNFKGDSGSGYDAVLNLYRTLN